MSTFAIMNISKQISEQITLFPDNLVFGYSQLDIGQGDYLNAAKIMERLQRKGTIKKISRGLFYKPKKTVFGEIMPDEKQILKAWLYEDGKRIAYVTGTYLYNQMGLTTQIPVRIQIASKQKRIFINNSVVKAIPSKSYVDVTDENYLLLGLLDALKDLRKIPDIDVVSAITILKERLLQLEEKGISAIIGYALLYPPRVRALLGAILETAGQKFALQELRDSLNPFTEFRMGITSDQLSAAAKWKIL
jgi:hypothetical protein